MSNRSISSSARCRALRCRSPRNWPNSVRFSRPVSNSSSAAYCPVTPILAWTSAAGRTASNPGAVADPAVGRNSVDRMLIVVVLPAPLCPSNAHTEARATAKLTPCSADDLLPNDFARSRHSMAASGIGVLLNAVGDPGEFGSHGFDVAQDRLTGDLGTRIGNDQLRSVLHAVDPHAHCLRQSIVTPDTDPQTVPVVTERQLADVDVGQHRNRPVWRREFS